VQSSVGTVQLPNTPSFAPSQRYPDQLDENKPGDDGGGSVVVVVDVVVDVVVEVVGVGFPASTTFRWSTVVVTPRTVRLNM
jgi:hypothetical protein